MSAFVGQVEVYLAALGHLKHATNDLFMEA